MLQAKKQIIPRITLKQLLLTILPPPNDGTKVFLNNLDRFSGIIHEITIRRVAAGESLADAKLYKVLGASSFNYLETYLDDEVYKIEPVLSSSDRSITSQLNIHLIERIS